jgi:hypothetical protein
VNLRLRPLSRAYRWRPTQQPQQLGEVHRHLPRVVARQPIWSPSVRRSDMSGIGGEAEVRGLRLNGVDDAEPATKRGGYLGPSLGSRFLISGLSYKTTFNSELRISSFPLYSI